MEELRTARVGRATIAVGTTAYLNDRIVRMAHTAGNDLIITTNTQHLHVLEYDEDFRYAYSQASLQTSDGWPVAALARYVSGEKVERTSGSDLIFSLCARAESEGLTVAVIGGAPGAAEGAVRTLTTQFPHLNVVLTHSAPPEVHEHAELLAELIESVDAAQPNILFVSMGSPKQEVFAAKHLMGVGANVTIGVGAGIDFAAGHRARAPRAIRSLGLEWAYRMMSEPRRLAPRYLTAGLHFLRIALPILYQGRRRHKSRA